MSWLDADRVPDGLGLQEGQQTPQARVRRPVLGRASQPGGPAANTRFTFPAASRSRSARSAGAAPVRSIALTSWCAASTGASSPSRPVSTLTTPPGTSEVASTSARLTAASTAGPLTASTAVLPVAMTGASTLTSPSSPASGGASTATTPVGSGTLRLKYGPATALAPPVTCATLSGQPAYQTHRSIAAATFRAAPARSLFFSPTTTSPVNCSARPSSISATRYRTWPRL